MSEAALTISMGARVKHPKFGIGIVVGIDLSSYQVFFKDFGDKEISREFEGLELIQEMAEAQTTISLKDVEQAVWSALYKVADFTEVVPLGEKWKGGTLLLQPFDHELKPKEIPIETFFHKIVLLRDRLRVLEQNINSHKVLTEEEKINLQQYITRIYGSLTTFNILFKNKEQFFKGEGKS